MLREEFPDDVLKLRPRKLRLGRDAERLLNDVCGTDGERSKSAHKSRLRPDVDSINAIRCADCGEVEYIARDYCRCGHYLAGQVIDEFLAWERGLVETRDRLAAAAERKMKPVRWVGASGIPFIIWPLLHSVFSAGSTPLTIWLWLIPGFAIMGLCALVETWITSARDASAHAVENATFEQFLSERVPVPSH
ncbi:hypothetical protein [Marivita hallyeonensis]|uniref:Uncharacterized protein n=1 Tax=Marivita hallyeonensis TaxID=996342 RepID=A0A1M5XGS8_9RHOB|nr:hypothetical protein [Marivita hallyeonensis]SHH99075.1 hypothetical protein SAMN05443551_3953 [Marivita hallyeonensis]